MRHSSTKNIHKLPFSRLSGIVLVLALLATGMYFLVPKRLEIYQVSTKDNPFAGAKLSGGKTQEKTLTQKVVDYVVPEKQKLTTSEPAKKANTVSEQQTGNNRLSNIIKRESTNPEDEDSGEAKPDPFAGAKLGGGYTGTNQDGNQVVATVERQENMAGGITTVTDKSVTDKKTGDVTRTVEMTKTDNKDQEYWKSEVVIEYDKQSDGQLLGKVTKSESSSTESTNNKLKDQIIGGPTQKEAKETISDVSSNNDKLCKAGNVTVSIGTWVATGSNMGSDRAEERQCTQIVAGCKHEGSVACHEVYKSDPSKVVLPVNAGTEYYIGKSASNIVALNTTPRPEANCVSNGETIPSGNEREGLGVCSNGTWVTEAEYVKPNNSITTTSDTTLTPVNFGRLGTMQDTLVPVNLNNEVVNTALNDYVYSGIGISLFGRELVIGSKASGDTIIPIVNIIPFKKKTSETDWDGLYNGINLSWLGGDLIKFGQSAEGAKFSLNVLDNYSLSTMIPDNIGGGITTGATSCGPLVYPCAVIGGIIGGINDFLTPNDASTNLNK